MKDYRGLVRLVAGMALAMTTLFPLAATGAAPGYTLVTATPGGTYYPVGVALSTLTRVKLRPHGEAWLAASQSAGSADNVRRLEDGRAQFAILQGLFGYYAWNGIGPVEEPQQDLRAVAVLWMNVDHFTIHSRFVDTGTIADLTSMAAEPMAMGSPGSGTIGSNRILLDNLGIDVDGFDLHPAGYGGSATALIEGEVSGMGTPAGVPVNAVTRAQIEMGGDAVVLGFTDEQAAAADGGLGIWTPYTIPAGTYPAQRESVQTVAQPNLLAVHADIPEEDVYRITRAIFDHLSFLQGVHSATESMSLDEAMTGLPLPLHPGAARYYREQGMQIPEHLDPDNL